MALRTPPSFLQNGSHPAENDRLTTQGIYRTSGVLYSSDLQVTQNSVPGMSVFVAAGWGNIVGTTQSNMGSYQFYNDATATATITTADPTNPRIDLICITVRDAYYTGVNNDVIINVVAGTPAGSPTVPTLPANSYALAQVAVAANATQILNANITDLRQVVAPVNVAQSVAGKNAIINGGMDIWQRGTSIAVAASTNAYIADRWQTQTGAAGALTISRQPTADTTNLPNIQYCLRYQRNSGQTYAGALQLMQNLETINSIPFAGKTVNISFYARAGANYSATSNALGVQVISGTGTDVNGFSSWVGTSNVILQTATLTTTWQRFTYSGTVPTTSTQLYVTFIDTTTGTAGANDYFEITGVQLELGSTATTFSRAGGSIGGELALCQRYYQRYTAPATNGTLLNGYYSSLTQMSASYRPPVTMRVLPSFDTTQAAGNFRVVNTNSGGVATVTSYGVNNIGAQDYELAFNFASQTGNLGFGTVVQDNAAGAAYLGFSAEL